MNIDINVIVGVISIVGSILGVGWKLGQIASEIRLEIAEIKGLLSVHNERIVQLERRVEVLESK
jgi:hypothetical protein